MENISIKTLAVDRLCELRRYKQDTLFSILRDVLDSGEVSCSNGTYKLTSGHARGASEYTLTYTKDNTVLEERYGDLGAALLRIIFMSS